MKNQCCIARKDDVVRAILPAAQQAANGLRPHSKHKSSLSLLNRNRGHRKSGSSGSGVRRTHSTAYSVDNRLKFAEMASNLTPQQIRASIKLYDKLSNIKV